MDKKPSIFIATPMYGGQCYATYVSSLLQNVYDLERNGIEVFWHFLGNESLVTRGRNYLTDIFLRSPATHMIFIDSDISFPREAIRKCILHDEDIVCAAYPKKMIDWQRIDEAYKQNVLLSTVPMSSYGASYVVNFLNPDVAIKPNEKGLLELRHAGTGFMCIKREVFEKLEPKMKKARASTAGRYSSMYTEYFYTEICPFDNHFLSEDWVFCDNWIKEGGKVYLDPSISLNHTGTYEYTGNPEVCGFNVT